MRRAGDGLLVMTYLRGIGRAPVSIQICQSISGRAEGEVLAFDTIDDAVADVLRVDDVFGQLVVSVGQQQVGAGRLDGEFVPQACRRADRSSRRRPIARRRRFLIMNSEGLAVEEELDVGVAAGAGGAQPVGRLSSNWPELVN